LVYPLLVELEPSVRSYVEEEKVTIKKYKIMRRYRGGIDTESMCGVYRLIENLGNMYMKVAVK
jgi:hypothetical protein